LSDGTVGSVSTRLRRRKATQPQRLVYCDLDFNISDEQKTNPDITANNSINNEMISNGSNEDQSQYTIDAMVLTDLGASVHQEEAGDEEEVEEVEEDDEEEAAVEEDIETVAEEKGTKQKVCYF
jgi:hypothetical protein